MQIRRKPGDVLTLQIRAAGTDLIAEYDVGHWMAALSRALADDDEENEWIELKPMGVQGLEQPGHDEEPSEELPAPIDPEAHLKEEDKTYRVWKAVGTTKDGRTGDFPIRAYSSKEAHEQIEKLEADGFILDRIVAPARR